MKNYLKKFAHEQPEELKSYDIYPHDWTKLAWDLPQHFNRVCKLGGKATKKINGLETKVKQVINTESEDEEGPRFEHWSEFTDLKSSVERIMGFCHRCISTFEKGEQNEETYNEAIENMDNLSKGLLKIEENELTTKGSRKTRPITLSFYLARFKSFLENCIYDTLIEMGENDKFKHSINEDEMRYLFADIFKDKIKVFVQTQLEEEGF